MKNKYQSHAESAFIGLVGFIVIVLVLAAQQCKSQSIMAGTGVISSGQWVSKISTQKLIANRFGFGIKCIDQSILSDQDVYADCEYELHQWSVSLVYTPPEIEDICFYVGGGQSKTNEKTGTCTNVVRNNTAEIGFMYRLLKPRSAHGRFSLYLDACIDSYSMGNTVISININLK